MLIVRLFQRTSFEYKHKTTVVPTQSFCPLDEQSLGHETDFAINTRRNFRNTLPLIQTALIYSHLK